MIYWWIDDSYVVCLLVNVFNVDMYCFLCFFIVSSFLSILFLCYYLFASNYFFTLLSYDYSNAFYVIYWILSLLDLVVIYFISLKCFCFINLVYYCCDNSWFLIWLYWLLRYDNDLSFFFYLISVNDYLHFIIYWCLY